jgi:hypothetical protein
MLRERPFLANSISGSIIAGLGDCLAQTYFKEWATRPPPPVLVIDTSRSMSREEVADQMAQRDKEFIQFRRQMFIAEYDVRRSLVFASFTVFFGTPFWLLVYKKIDARFPKQPTPLIAIKKGIITWVLANSTTPLFITYLTAMDALVIKKKSQDALFEALQKVPAKIATNWPVMMKYSICFWSVQWLPLFYYLKPEFRLLYVSFLQIVWSCITSYVLHGKKQGEEKST